MFITNVTFFKAKRGDAQYIGHEEDKKADNKENQDNVERGLGENTI